LDILPSSNLLEGLVDLLQLKRPRHLATTKIGQVAKQDKNLFAGSNIRRKA
jgi:hypothetical protein